MKTKTRINQTDQDILDELIACARKVVATHTRELDEREKLHREGKKAPDKWDVSPATIRGVLSLVPKLLEIRRVLHDLPPLTRERVTASKQAAVRAAPKSAGPQPVDFTNINNAISRAAQLGIK